MWKRVHSRRLLCTAEVMLRQKCWDVLLQPFCWGKIQNNCNQVSLFCMLLWWKDCRKIELLTRPEIVGKNPLPLFNNCLKWILSAQLRGGVWITRRIERKWNRVRSDSWRHLFLKEIKRWENKIEFVDTVSYIVFGVYHPQCFEFVSYI